MTQLTQGAFAEQLNSKFRINVEGQEPLELELSRVSDLNLTFGTEAFSIVFTGPKEFVLAQGTYQFEHDQMGSFRIMIVPIGRTEQGTNYEAVFNRLVAK